MGVGPPKCRTCHKVEWNHTCAGPVEPTAKKKRDRRLYNREYWRNDRGPKLKGKRKGKPSKSG
jgi:hypothetical protein